MDVLNMIVLGVIQGIAEFLPISSSGHLAIASRLLGVNDDPLLVAVVLHAGSFLSIIAVYYKDVISLFSREKRKMLPVMFVAIIPIGVTGVLFQIFKLGELAFENLFFPAFGLLLTGWLLLYGMRSSKNDGKSFTEITMTDALWIGLLQCVAILPGVSRSGTTISTALKRGVQRDASAAFSFLIAVPVLAGAGLVKGSLYFYRVVVKGQTVESASPALLFLGFAVSAAVGYVALRFLISTLKKGLLSGYAYYCFTLGGAILIWQLCLLF